ncbi:MAG: YaiI/YqxD family protein, partial [Candidatus Rokuibacteriota bacterium]
MRIWVDADACPQAIKEILFRAAERAQVVMTLVANTPLRTPSSPFIRAIRVPKGFDGADHRI